MEKTVNFTYKSIGNLVKLFATIQFEKNNDSRAVAIWHERFDEEDGDELFESFLVKLFPEGKTIQPEDVETIVKHAEWFLEKDEKTQSIRNKYIKLDNPFWVYFKPDNIVRPCDFGNHSKIVTEICYDFFKDFESLDVDYLNKFILDNFEIASNNTTVSTIAKNALFIRNFIMIEADIRKEG